MDYFNEIFNKNFTIFAIFWKNFKILSKFLRKFRKFWKYAFVGGSGAEPPGPSEIIKNLVEKSMETCKRLKIFMNYESIFYLKS